MKATDKQYCESAAPVRSVYAHRVIVDSVELPTRANAHDRFLASVLAADDSVYVKKLGDKKIIENKLTAMNPFEAF